jgi:hypothetical protein
MMINFDFIPVANLLNIYDSDCFIFMKLNWDFDHPW